MFWTLIGVLLSYLGVLFSLYAVLEVQDLSKRYFTKQRLPQLEKSLTLVGKKLMAPGELTVDDLRSNSSVGEAAVLLRAISDLKLANFTMVLAKAEKSHSQIDEILSNGLRKDILAKNCDEYWNFARSMSELTDEVKFYQTGVQASL